MYRRSKGPELNRFLHKARRYVKNALHDHTYGATGSIIRVDGGLQDTNLPYKLLDL